MPSHLHPRSRLTTSLFGTTLAVSFLVVGMPHLFPCPAPGATYADTEMLPDGRRVRRKQRRKVGENGLGSRSDDKDKDHGKENLGQKGLENVEAGILEAKQVGRECPVPKPRALLDSLLHLHSNRREDGEGSNENG